MASADPPAGLMDIASTLNPDEIPFKLRCAICSKLALSAFRLPCCDQAICESCQVSLPETCPVCAHNPVSSDLCKPNKALRTTLKAFLRTEEKKREKDRQSTITPADDASAPTDSGLDQSATDATPTKDATAQTLRTESTSHERSEDAPAGTVTENGPERDPVESVEPVHRPDQAADHPPASAEAAGPTESNRPAADSDAPVNGVSALSAAHGFPQPDPSLMAQNIGPGGFPGMGWNAPGNFSAMNPFMANGMYNSPTAMGMPMGMDPMAANQGMFGDYGMNMTGIMNTGMNFNGQGMYGSLAWDGSQQNHAMWHGGQDKFNPNAFANGMDPPYGGLGGSNMSPYPSNPDFQTGYHAPGYGLGRFRDRGRGHFQGSARGGFGGPMLGHHLQANSPGFANQSNPTTAAPDATPVNAEAIPQTNAELVVEPVSDENATTGAAEAGGAGFPVADNSNQHLQGIPTINSVDHSTPAGPGAHTGHPEYGRGGYMNGPGRGRGVMGGMMPGSYQPNLPAGPRGPRVKGAPAAPRAMRQGLPNTSVLRQRGFQDQGHAFGPTGNNTQELSQGGAAEPTVDDTQTQSPAKAPSQSRAATRSASPPNSHAPGPHSPSLHDADDDRESRQEKESRRSGRADESYLDDRRSPPASPRSSRRSSRRRHRESERERERERKRARRPRRHRSRTNSPSRSPSRDRDGRHPDRLALIAGEAEANGLSKPSSERGIRDLAIRISNTHRSSKDQPSRREEERDRGGERESRRRERDRDRERGRRKRDRDAEDEHRADRDRKRERPRKRDRKRSRRDRSESANAGDYSRAQDRRAKRSRAHEDHDRDRTDGVPSTATEPEKDPHTLEREARNRERLLREKQRREMAKSGRRRDSRQERVVGGRRINYKYEDELEH